MLGFTLSKLNMLIFVSAIFMIIAFFTFGMRDVFLSWKAQQVIERVHVNASDVLNSRNICDQTIISPPERLSYFEGAGDFFYIMRIRHLEAQEEDEPNHIVFTIENREGIKKTIAVKRLDTEATVKLYWVDPATGSVEEKDEIVIDPQATQPMNAVLVVKETYEGQQYIYFVPCSTNLKNCEQNRLEVGRTVAGERGMAVDEIPKCFE
jgi:hypothetical protein